MDCLQAAAKATEAAAPKATKAATAATAATGRSAHANADDSVRQELAAGSRPGWPPIASALKNESMRRWRLLDGPVCARSPLDFGVNPGTVQRIIRPFVAASVAVG